MGTKLQYGAAVQVRTFPSIVTLHIYTPIYIYIYIYCFYMNIFLSIFLVHLSISLSPLVYFFTSVPKHPSSSVYFSAPWRAYALGLFGFPPLQWQI